MSEEKKSPSKEAVITAEYRLLNALAKNVSYFDDLRVSDNIFVDEIAKSIYEGILSLKNRNIKITESSLLQSCNDIDFNVTENIINKVFSIDQEGAETLDDIIPVLNNAVLKNSLLNDINNIRRTLSKAGNIDTANIQSSLYEFDRKIKESNKEETSILSLNTLFNKYVEDLNRRREGKVYSFGDYYLDKYITKGAAPGSITTIAASTNMGKTTFGMNMIANLIESNSPCMYVSLEMGTIDVFDKLISRNLGIANDILYDNEAMDDVISQVEEERERLRYNNKFCLCEATGVDIPKLRNLIKEFKQKTNSDYALVMIDLISGMKDFMTSVKGGSAATSIEVMMNRLEELAKEENVHFVCIVQLRRDSDAGKVLCEDDIERLRPSIGDIKNSGAVAEKSTTVLTLFRKKYYIDRYLPEMSINQEDKLDVTVLKSRNCEPGMRFEYKFDGRLSSLTPIVNEIESNQDLPEMI